MSSSSNVIFLSSASYTLIYLHADNNNTNRKTDRDWLQITMCITYNTAMTKLKEKTIQKCIEIIKHTTGWPQSRRKNYLSFPGFSRAINLLFHRLSQQKVNVIMTFVKGHDDPVYPVNSCFTQIFEWWTKNTLFVTFFPDVAQNSQNSLSFPGLWPPCTITGTHMHRQRAICPRKSKNGCTAFVCFIQTDYHTDVVRNNKTNTVSLNVIQ